MNILKQIIGIDVSMDNIEVRFGTIDITQSLTITNSVSFKNTKQGFKKLVLIAVARKLLLLIYTLWKNDTEYIPNYSM